MGLVAALVVIAATTWWYLRRDVYSESAEWWRQTVLDYEENDPDAPLETGNRSQITIRAVAHARTELGLLGDSLANRLVVSDVVRKFMKNHGMRPTHISAMFQLAVEVYFLRSTGDEELRLMRNSRGYQKYRRTTNNL